MEDLNADATKLEAEIQKAENCAPSFVSPLKPYTHLHVPRATSAKNAFFFLASSVVKSAPDLFVTKRRPQQPSPGSLSGMCPKAQADQGQEQKISVANRTADTPIQLARLGCALKHTLSLPNVRA